MQFTHCIFLHLLSSFHSSIDSPDLDSVWHNLLYCRQSIKGFYTFEVLIPVCFPGSKDMSQGSYGNITVQASCRDHQKLSFHLKIGQSGSAMGAEALYVAFSSEVIRPHQVFSGEPDQSGSRGKRLAA